MHAACPSCNAALSWWKLRGEFTCPHCGSSLSAKTTGAFISTIVLWVLIDIPVKLLLFEMFGAGSTAGLLSRIFVSGAIGWGLAFFIVGSFSTITVRHAP